MLEKVEVTLGRLIMWGLAIVTLVVTPLWALDPINPVKMMLLGPVAFISLGLLVINRKVIGLGRYKNILYLVVAFVGWMLAVVAFSGAGFNQQIFGAIGRNTGFVTYLCFLIVFVAAMVASSADFLRRFLKVVVVVGVASLVYGLVQAFGADPFEWVNPYSPVFGFLGNPNFQSSLLGILGSIVFPYLLVPGVLVKWKLAIVTYLGVTLYVIKETASQQGFLVLLTGMIVIVGVYLKDKNKQLSISYGVLSLMGFIGVLLGTLNKGPLAGLLYKDSVTYRGDYWRAGWKMTVDHPVFGVGLDSYGDWYRRSRTVAATVRRGPETISNAAHNVYLDISSYGGFPLLIIYAALMAFVVVSVVKVLKRGSGFNAGFAGLVGGWVAFQAQSIISINQIGLAIWGWVLSGLIIGYEINTRGVAAVEEKRKGGRVAKKAVQTSASTSIVMFVGLVVGVLVAMPPYVASARFKAALESGNAQVVKDAAYLWPADASRMIQVASALSSNNLTREALQVAVDATVKFPDNFATWQTLSVMTDATADQKAQALREMKRLDPNNTELK